MYMHIVSLLAKNLHCWSTRLELSPVLECNPKPLPSLDVQVPGKRATSMYMYMYIRIYLKCTTLS